MGDQFLALSEGRRQPPRRRPPLRPRRRRQGRGPRRRRARGPRASCRAAGWTSSTRGATASRSSTTRDVQFERVPAVKRKLGIEDLAKSGLCARGDPRARARLNPGGCGRSKALNRVGDVRPLTLLLPLALLVALPSQAAASDLPYREPAGSRAPHVLPATGATAARLQPSTWLVGARARPPRRRRRGPLRRERLSPRGIYASAAVARATSRRRCAPPASTASPSPIAAAARARGSRRRRLRATDWRTFLSRPG